MNDLTSKPDKTIGIVPIKIDLNNFFLKKGFNDLCKFGLKNLNMSFLKYQTSAKTLPNCIIADIEGPGSSNPKN